MTNQQGAPEALRLANIADDEAWAFVIGVRKEIATELRRLHAENERLAALVEAQQPVSSTAGAVVGQVVGYRISDPSEPDLGHWLSEDPGAAWCVSEPLVLAHPAVDGMAKELDAARDSLQWYMRRCEQLQRVQHRMRDPERTMVCDILANGSLLVPEGQRYSAPQPSPTPQADSVPSPQQEAQEPVAYAIFAENGNIRLWATEPQHVKRIAVEQGLSLVKLYTAPQPAPAPLSEREVFEATWEKVHGKKPVLWETMFAQQKQETPPHCVGRYYYRDAQAAWGAWQARAALAAQGGKA